MTSCWNDPEPKASSCPTVPETVLYQSLHAMLKEETNQQEPLNRGMLRWTLHQKVKNSPSSSLTLVTVLLKELEKAERGDHRRIILPLLHTLMYAVLQTNYIPDDVYKRVYDVCKRLLTFPDPYCAVGLSYSRLIKAERCSPGLRFQRMVVSEQRLRSDHYPLQERVFLLADPDIFSADMAEGLSRDIKASNSQHNDFVSPYDHMCCVVQHTLQAVLGDECDAARLARSLKEVCVHTHFQEVLASGEEASCSRDGRTLRTRLRLLYDHIVTDSGSGGSLRDRPLPNPEMSFHMWTEKFDIWRELSMCLRSASTEKFSSSQDQDDLDEEDVRTSDQTRHSVMSTDSGIVGDLPPGPDSPVSPPDPPISSSGVQSKSGPDWKLNRRQGMKMKPTVKGSILLMQDMIDGQEAGGRREGLSSRRAGSRAVHNTFTKKEKNVTAKIVVMGDDRVLGRLAKAYHHLRKREARRRFLTMRFNLQFYYVPVCSTSDPKKTCSLGSYLGQVDPWFNCNVRGLGCSLPRLLRMQQTAPGKPSEPFVSDALSYYLRAGQQPVLFTVYAVKIFHSTLDPEEDVFLTHLHMDFPEVQPSTRSMREKRRGSTADLSGVVVSLNYKEARLGGRDASRGVSVRTAGLQIRAFPANEAEDLNCLTVTLNETSSTRNKNVSPDSTIRTNEVKIRSAEGRAFTVTLDQDCRRTYKHVHSIHVFPCVDPGFSVQKTLETKVKLGDERSAGLSKYMNKGLPLPINTFSGVIS